MNPMNQRPNYLIHVGRPDSEEPHKSMERVEKYHQDNPTNKVVIVLWEEKDVQELEPKINKELCKILYWKDDSAALAFMLDNIAGMVGAQIVCPRWYICTEKHITKSTGANMIEKCPECSNAVAFMMPEKERFQAFAKVFGKVINLTNFDTTSGQYLHSAVNPMKNLLLNMRYALTGLSTADLKDSLTGKPIIICGAGPSLEDAIPHLKRLQHKVAIACVGRAFKALKAAGIKVAYTITVEMFDWDFAIFENLSEADYGDTVMLYASVCASKVVEVWKGKKACLWDIETSKILERPDYILGGNSVSHHMLNFAAQILNAEPIILCGIDLAYVKPKTHAEGTIPEGWPEEMKKKDAEYQDELWVACTGKGDFHPECHRTPGMFMGGGGGFAFSKMIEVRSSYAYENFATLFSVLIEKHKKKVFNACPNGQKIQGAEYLNLASYDP